MSCRTTDCYKAVFQFIDDNIFHLEPTEFITDFELGMRKAINIFYPSAKLRGCWFHYCRAIRRKMISLGLFKFVKNDEKANRIYHSILNLPLLPSEDFMEGYEKIKEQAKRHSVFKKFTSFFEYYNSYWIVQVGNHGCTAIQSRQSNVQWWK